MLKTILKDMKSKRDNIEILIYLDFYPRGSIFQF